MNRILTLGALLLVGLAAGCSKDDSPAQPKAANPQGNPGLKRDAMPGGAAPKTSGALKD